MKLKWLKLRFVVLWFILVLFDCGGVVNAARWQVKFRRDYIFFEEFNTFIKVNTKALTWFEAYSYCKAEGAELAVIRTAEEAKAIVQVLEAFPKDRRTVWIGLQDLVSKRIFETIDGVPMAEVYGEWDTWEPSDSGGHEDCIEMYANGKLNDNTCTEKRSFICRKDADTVRSNARCNNFDPEYRPVLHGTQCIKYHSTPKTWEQAFTICNAEQGHLAIINSQEEADLYRDEFAKYPEVELKGYFNKEIIFLGFHDKLKHGNYITVQGNDLSTTGYTEWADGQPDCNDQNANCNEHCGSMFRNGKLNDVDCQTKAMFICEIPLAQ